MVSLRIITKYYTDHGGGGHLTNYSFAHDELYTPISFGFRKEVPKAVKNPKITIAIDFWPLHIGYHIIKTNAFIDNIINVIPEFQESFDIRLEKLSATQAFVHLFDACSKGCIYHGGFNGSLGRLKSWQSMATMVGIETPKSNTEISRCMQEFDWYRFNTKEWFINEVCDFGLICYNPKTHFCSVIAGTDTD